MSSLPHHLILVGPMGSGKTTIGAQLAQRLGWPHLDTDRWIEASSGLSIAEIFRREGEDGFRQRERQLVQAVGLIFPCVVSTGGGILLDQENYRQLALLGPLIHLTASPETLSNRLQNEVVHRPLLSNDRWRERLEELLTQREAIYAQADYVFATDGLTPQMITDRILNSLGFPIDPEALSDLWVELSDRRYPLHFTYTGWQELAERLTTQGSIGRKLMIISDEVAAEHYLEPLEQALTTAGFEVIVGVVPAGESTKSLQQVERLYRIASEARLGRKSAIIALGGGVVGDLAGFIAATYLRGLPFIQIPTTLLAMVDSSVGGKVGVNLPTGKNLVGAFHQPILVWLDLSTLQTLSPTVFRSGLAEIIKAAAIADKPFFSKLERDMPAILQLEQLPLASAIRRSCAIKAKVVVEDERETGVRAILNFGHTLGHAIEQQLGYTILHGEAVSIGMCFAARLSAAMGMCNEGASNRMIALLEQASLPTKLPAGLSIDGLMVAMQQDKKIVENEIRFVLLKGIGKVEYGVPISHETLESALRAFATT